MTTRDIVMASAGLGESNYIAAYGHTGTSNVQCGSINPISYDTNNIYLSASYGTTSVAIKTDANGNLIYSKYLSSSSSTTISNLLALNDGTAVFAPTDSFGWCLKLNNSGTLTNQVLFGAAATCPILDADATYIYAKQVRSASPTNVYLLKIDTSLNTATYSQATSGYSGTGSQTIASDGNYVWYSPGEKTGTYVYGVGIIRASKSTLATNTPVSYRLSTTSSSSYPTSDVALSGLGTGSGGFVMGCWGKNATYPTNGLAIAAIVSSSGTVTAQRALVLTSSLQRLSIKAMPDGGAICAFTLAAVNPPIHIFRISSSGTLLWKRQITGTIISSSQVALSICGNSYVIAADGTNVVGGTGTDLIVAKLPIDGTKTGSYTLNGFTFDYATSSLSDVVSNMTSYSYTPTAAYNSTSATVSSETVGNRALTSTSQVI